MKTSIVMATKDKDQYLRRVLDSIYVQNVPFDYEVIVVDDGSTDTTPKVCADKLRIGKDRYVRLDNDRYRNPSVARNVGYRLARGEIVIAQSDDVIHHTPTSIEVLSNRLEKSGEFLIATVHNYDMIAARIIQLYTGKGWKRPFFFLGSLWRRDLYAVGGNDEDFIDPGYDDDWFGDCLTKGLKLIPKFLDDVVGLHQSHPKPKNLSMLVRPSSELYARKIKMAKMGEIPWQARGGPWECKE